MTLDGVRLPMVASMSQFRGGWFFTSLADQSAMFASVSLSLKPNAPFLFTATEINGVGGTGITGTMNGVSFDYYAVPSYQDLIGDHGPVLVSIHDDPGVSTYYLSRKLP